MRNASNTPTTSFSHNPSARHSSPTGDSPCLTTDLICLSHLRWDFVFQRPQHLMGRFARHRRVFFFEEPVFDDSREPRLDLSRREEGISVLTPHLPAGTSQELAVEMQRFLTDELLLKTQIRDATFWYYTPMALAFTNHLEPERVIYDCMDELSAFRGAPTELLSLEQELFRRAHHVFTGGLSLFEKKRSLHPSVHPFPSSIEFEHFSRARKACPEPRELVSIPHPRIGFFGVIDERSDLELLRCIALLRPEWQIIMIGPVAKIDEATLPRLENIHYLGKKSYQELPAYLAHWDLAILPFALNESTRYISPTKTPEYLAAGRPVVSTPIQDVVRPYGELGLVHIADGPHAFVNAGEAAMHERKTDMKWLERIDHFLSRTSWDETWSAMAALERAIGEIHLNRFKKRRSAKARAASSLSGEMQ